LEAAVILFEAKLLLLILLDVDDASTTTSPNCLDRPAKYQPNNLEAYCNTLVNLSRPSNVNTQAIQFLIWNGERLEEMPVWMMVRAFDFDDDVGVGC